MTHRILVVSSPYFDGSAWQMFIRNTGTQMVTLYSDSAFMFQKSSAGKRAFWSTRPDGGAATDASINAAPSARIEVFSQLSEIDILLEAPGSPFLPTAIINYQPSAPSSINVRSFGATADGISDDSIPLQNAVDFCSALGGGEVLLPSGTYGISTTLRLRSNVHMRGLGSGLVGQAVATIRALTAAMTMLEAEGQPPDQLVFRVQLTDLHIDGFTGSAYAGCGFRMMAATNFSIRRCRFTGINGTFLLLIHVWDSWFYDNYFDWAPDGTTAPMVDLQSYQTPGPPAYLGNTNSLHFVNCRWGSYRSTALRLLGLDYGVGSVNGIYLTGCQFESVPLPLPATPTSPRVVDITLSTRVILHHCSFSVTRLPAGMGDFVIRAAQSTGIMITDTTAGFQESGMEMPFLGLADCDMVSLLGGGFGTQDVNVPPIHIISGHPRIDSFGFIVTDTLTWTQVPNVRLVSGTPATLNAFSTAVYVGARDTEPSIAIHRTDSVGTTQGLWYIGRLGGDGRFRILRGGTGFEEEALTIGYGNSEARFRGRLLPAVGSTDALLTFADGDTSPTVALGNVFRTANAAPTAIATFDDAASGQFVTVLVRDSNTTFLDGQGISLRGSADFAAQIGDALSLVYDVGVWREVGRSSSA